jgi:hypothetical protein
VRSPSKLGEVYLSLCEESKNSTQDFTTNLQSWLDSVGLFRDFMASLDSAQIRDSTTGAEILKFKHLYGTPNKKADT